MRADVSWTKQTDHFWTAILDIIPQAAHGKEDTKVEDKKSRNRRFAYVKPFVCTLNDFKYDRSYDLELGRA